MKEDLSRKEIIRCIVNGFEVFMEYWVDLGINIWKNGRKTHIMAFFSDLYRYTLNMYRYRCSRTEPVPVQVRYTMLCFDQFLYFSYNLLIYYLI